MQSGRSRRSRRGPSAVRILGWFALGLVAFVVVLTGVGLALINTEAGENWVKREALERARQTVPGLAIADLDGFLPFNVVLEGVRVQDDEGRPAIEVARAEVDPDLWAILVQGDVELDEVTLREPRVRLVQDTQGEWNLTQLIVEEKDEEAEQRDVVVEDLRVTDGRVLLSRPDEQVAQLTDVSLRGSFRSIGQQLTTSLSKLALDYRAGEVEGALRAEAHAQLEDERVNAWLQAQVAGLLRPGPTSVAASLEGPRDDARLEMRVGARADPLLRVAGRVGLERQAYELRAVVDDFDPSALALGADLPKGRVDLTLTATGTGVPLEPGTHARLHVRSDGFPIAGTRVETLEGTASTRGQRWSVGDFHVAGRGFRGQATGSGTSETFRARASLDASSLGPLELAGKTFRYEGQAQARLERRAGGQLEIDAAVTADDAQWGDTRLRHLTTELTGRLDPSEQTGRLRLEATEPFLVNDVRLTGVEAVAQAGQATLRLQGVASLATDAGKRLTPVRAEAMLPLEAGAGWSLATHQPLQAEARWSGASLAQVARLVGLDLAVGGQLTLVAEASGTLDAPQIHARATVERGRFRDTRDLGAALEVEVRQEQALAALQATLRGQPLLNARAQTSLGGGELLEQERWLEVPFEIVANMPATPAERLADLAPVLREVTARLSADLRATGTVAHPVLTATVRAVQPGTGRRDAVTSRLELQGEARENRSEVRAVLRLEEEVVLRVRGQATATPTEAIEGEVPDTVRVLAEARLGPLPLDAVGRLYAPLEAFAGTLQGEVRVRGPTRALEGEAELRGEGLRGSGQVIGDLEAAAELTRERGDLHAKLSQETGRATLAAQIDDGGRTRLEMILDRVDVGVLRANAPRTTLADDDVSGRLLARGFVAARTSSPDSAQVPPFVRLTDPAFIRGSVEVDDLRLALYINHPREEREVEPEKAKPARWDERLREVVDFHLERLQVADSRVRLVDGTVKGNPGLDLHDVALTLENVASRRADMNGVPSVLTFRALVEGAAETTAFATFDPLAEEALAAGHAALRTLKLSKLSEFLRPMYDVRVPQGMLSVFATFRLQGQDITGSIKPIIADPEIEPADTASFFEKLGIEIVDLATDIFSDEVAGRDAVATVVPIQGRLGNANAQIVPAILGVIRNAFVVGLASGYAHLPLDVAARDQSIFQQAIEALDPGRFIKTQPEE